MADIPQCANFLEGRCKRSQTFVEREGDTFFTIRCRTCQGINIFPKDLAEKKGRYDSFLRRKMEQEQAVREAGQKPIYSK